MRTLMLGWAGNRLHPMLNRLGGLATEPPTGWFEAVERWLTDVEVAHTALGSLMTRDSWREAALIAPLTIDLAKTYGVTGPAVRALAGQRGRSGLDYAAIGADEVVTPLSLPDPGRATAADRFAALLADLVQSVTLVRRSVERAAEVDGAVNVPLSKIIKLPDAEIWFDLDAPLGMSGFHLVSRAGTTPWRLKLRTPTFANVNALQALLVGCTTDQVALVVASMGYTIGDLDK